MRTLVATIVGMALAAQAQAGALLLEPSRDLRTLLPGDAFEVTLATGADAGNLMGGVFDLTYDADVLGYLGADFAPLFAMFNNDQAASTVGASGLATIADISFSGFLAGTGGGAADLVTLKFAALQPGTSEIGVAPSRSGFTDSGGVPLDLTMPRSLEAIVTPVPAALPLLATALFVIGAIRRYQQRAG